MKPSGRWKFSRRLMRPAFWALAFSLGIAAAEPPPVSFRDDLVPILLDKCLSCHGADKAKGGYRIHNFEAVNQPGKSKAPAVVPGKPEESELYKRLTASDEDDRMPQKDEPLPKEQIELFRRWIAQGATLDAGDPRQDLSSLLPPKPHPTPPLEYPRAVPVLALAFTRSGTEILSGGYHEVLVWSLDGRLAKRITNAPRRIRAIVPIGNGPLAAIAGGKPGRGGELSIYNLETGHLETNLFRTADELLTATVSSDGKWLAAGGTDHSIHVFDLEKNARALTIQQHADWVMSLAFNDDGTKIASASRDRTARIYNARTGELETTYTGHGAAVCAVAFAGPDTVVSGGRDRALHFWNAKEGKKTGEISGFSPDAHQLVAAGGFVFLACADKETRQYSASDRKLIRTLGGHAEMVYSLAYHPGSGTLASGAFDGTIKLWDARDGTARQSFIAAPLAHNAR